MPASFSGILRPHGEESQAERLFYCLMSYSPAQGILLLNNLFSYFQGYYSLHLINILLTADVMFLKEIQVKGI